MNRQAFLYTKENVTYLTEFIRKEIIITSDERVFRT